MRVSSAGLGLSIGMATASTTEKKRGMEVDTTLTCDIEPWEAQPLAGALFAGVDSSGVSGTRAALAAIQAGSFSPFAVGAKETGAASTHGAAHPVPGYAQLMGGGEAPRSAAAGE